LLPSSDLRWQEILDHVSTCSKCGDFAAEGSSAWNGCKPPSPTAGNTLFLSEAPPGGVNHSFFLCELEEDKLRKNLFRGFRESRQDDFKSVSQFLEAGYYLLPSFSFPCRKRGGGNANPPVSAIKHSADFHLREIIAFMRPKKIVLLGRSALIGGLQLGLVEKGKSSRLRDYLGPHKSKRWKVETFVTYWPQKRRKDGEDWHHLKQTLGGL
jgi:uracil-DNA glycosylase